MRNRTLAYLEGVFSDHTLNMKLLIFRNKKGQALIEFALLLPILLLVMLAVFQIQLMMEGKQKTQMATWYAIRAHSDGTSEDDIKDKIKEVMFNDDDSQFDIDFSHPSSFLTTAAVINVFMIPQEVKAEVTYKTPYFFKGMTWVPVAGVFSNVKSNVIEVSSSNQMLEKK